MGEVAGRTRGRKLTRIAVAGALLAATVATALLMFGCGGYEVEARFYNAGQLVKGNEVRAGGVTIGSVEELELADNGMAIVRMSIDDDRAPLDRGTRAFIRFGSLSGIANRYVDLQLPRGGSGDEIRDGGSIRADRTQAAVDVDQLLETFDARTRRSLRGLLRGFGRQWKGKGEEAARGYEYLSPALASSTRLFRELSGDARLLERFVVDSAGLVTTVAARRDDLAGAVQNLNTTTRAIGNEKEALAEVLERFPPFMRRANTTFVNLRATLDDVDPLVTASTPVARELQSFLPQLRRFAGDIVPTVRDLSRTVRRRGGTNDVIDLLRTFPPLTDVAIERRRRNGRVRPGAFPATTRALRAAAPLIAFGRPYTPDMVGWFDDFSHTGGYDAIGGFSRSQIYFNPFSVSLGSLPDLGGLTPGALSELLDQVQSGRGTQFLDIARVGQYRRCPGHAEVPAPDGSNVYTPQQREAFDCRAEDRATGQATGG